MQTEKENIKEIFYKTHPEAEITVNLIRLCREMNQGKKFEHALSFLFATVFGFSIGYLFGNYTKQEEEFVEEEI